MFIILCILAYLLGSVSFAVLLSRLHGITDPRLQGSGNPGASNMLRSAGRRLAILTLVGDLGKGWSVVVLAAWLGLSLQQQAWAGFAAILGHIYPLYFRFQGGKGVATTAGVLLALYPPAALLALCIWLAAFYLSRTSSLASLSAMLLTLPLLIWQLPQLAWPAALLCLLLSWAHRHNLKDLWDGTERRF